MNNTLKIAGFLSGLRDKVKQCPCCQECTEFSFANEILYIPSISGSGELPVISGSCKNCGYVLLFSAKDLVSSEQE